MAAQIAEAGNSNRPISIFGRVDRRSVRRLTTSTCWMSVRNLTEGSYNSIRC